jgi:hypothetical protein
VLPVDEDVDVDEIDLYSDELAKIFADSPIPRATKSKLTEKAAVAKEEVDNEDDGVFANTNDSIIASGSWVGTGTRRVGLLWNFKLHAYADPSQLRTWTST